MTKLRKIELTPEHVNTALTGYLLAMTMINDNEEIVLVKEGSKIFYVTAMEDHR